jgi:16S rRNA G966 N2-methylase RsmD
VPADHYRIIKGDYNRTVIHLGKDGYKFDIIFLDPPYQLLEYANPLKVVYKREILKDDGFAVLERPSHFKFDSKYFDCYRSRKIGRRNLDFFKHLNTT